ncbi:hypothetical protein [uncultured Bacteroides sp.]|uniref:hypothetical protein n=1 Tax=uncultured Bacteroides sp. TaxID=162156 RepID=UPI000822E9FC|nr:hypothetical protein [uncultured Bacteroides sp.]SCH85828.1 Uncharacterized protein conserved in bacteria [uncultured Bacteroides sp.]
MGNIKLLYPFNNSQYQSFMQGLADEFVESGIPVISPKSIPIEIRLIVAKLKISCNFRYLVRGRNLIVLCGGYPDYAAFPFAYTNNIIPIIWDSWPKYWDRIIDSFKRHNVKLAFFTQSRSAEYVHKHLPKVECVYIPEGLNPMGYKKGKQLKDRSIDVLELGRLYKPVHDKLEKAAISFNIRHQFAKDVTKKRLFDTFEDLTDGLADAKIVINYPRCITHPEMAGEVETLTQRYWECMYSRCVMLGHAPQELINLIGYNPVIECEINNIQNQVLHILSNIDSYQKIVNDNYEAAMSFGSWQSRLSTIYEKLGL